jgi:HEAT repeat protein
MDEQDIGKLIADLSSKEPGERAAAAEQLAHRGELARGAAVALVRACADDQEEVREWVVAALEGLGPPAAEDLGKLAELTADASDDICYWAATLLGRAGRAASDAVATLANLLAKRPSPEVRRRAAWALGQIGPAAGAVDALQRAAHDPDRRIARAAQSSLEDIASHRETS